MTLPKYTRHYTCILCGAQFLSGNRMNAHYRENPTCEEARHDPDLLRERQQRWRREYVERVRRGESRCPKSLQYVRFPKRKKAKRKKTKAKVIPTQSTFDVLTASNTNHRFCTNCGTPRTQTTWNFCPSCGEEYGK
jgi:hypothetical protein